MASRRTRSVERRTMWARAGDRSILVNDPAGFPSSTPWVHQPGVGFINPGVAWMGADSPAWFRAATPGAGLPQVSRALGLIADSIAAMPWAVYRGRDRLAEPAWLRDPQNAQGDSRGQPLLLTHPMPVMAFRSQMLASLVMHGEAFLYHPWRDGEGRPLAPGFILNPTEVESFTETLTLSNGKDLKLRRFKVGSFEIPAADLLHIRGRAPYTVEGRGQGVLARHADSLRLAEGVRAAVASAYSSGVPNGYIKVTQPGLTQPQADALKAGWMAAHGSSRSIAVLNATTEFQPLSWSLSDLAAVEMGAFTDKDIAHAFGMSAHYLDVPGDSSTYANVQDRVLDFRTFTLLPWARLVESALESWLPAGTTLKIKLEGLERANLTTRDTSYTARLAAGVMTVDEVRTIEDMPPLPDQGEAPQEVPDNA